MALTIKALNSDTSFLLTFSPPIAPPASPASFPGSFTILIDPWITGSAKILSPKFSISEHTVPPCISSLADLPEPDVILISQDKPDHCHEETLRQLPPTNTSLILGTPAAAKKIRSWNHFDPSRVHALPKYDPKRAAADDSLFRLAVPAFSPSGSPGEVTVAHLPAKRDVTGLHNAIGITYRPPSSVLSRRVGCYLDLLPPTPPASPARSPASTTTTSVSISGPIAASNAAAASPRSTVVPAPFHDREKTLSVLYSPHGVAYGAVAPYASGTLVAESALPLTALLHSLDRVRNPWVLGGTVATGFPGGVEIARRLLPRVWVGAHDEDKDNRGVSVMRVKTARFGVQEVRRMLRGEGEGARGAVCPGTEVVSLEAGEVWRVAPS